VLSTTTHPQGYKCTYKFTHKWTYHIENILHQWYRHPLIEAFVTETEETEKSHENFDKNVSEEKC
jgi:hypothetical protein